MPNFNKLFTLDSETITILKESKNQSKMVRDAVKSYSKQSTVIKEDTPVRQEGKIIGVEVD